MKEIDIDDEVYVGNKIYIVVSVGKSYSYNSLSSSSYEERYSIRDADGSSLIYKDRKDVVPVKTLQQKIDDLLDYYNLLMSLAKEDPNGIYRNLTEDVMSKLKA